MKFSIPGMRAATKLTQSGKLLEATALIQQLLSKGAESAPDQPQPQRSSLPPALNPPEPSGKRDEPSEERSPPKTASNKEKRVGRFESKQFSSNQGHRLYKLFTPSAAANGPLPLVVMLHGCTQTPDDFAAGTQMNQLAEEQGFYVAYPAQSASANSMGCWNWFNSSDQLRDSGEPALIAGIVRQIAADCAVDQSQIYIAGLSSGGGMAAILGMAYPDLFAAIGVHSGLACGAAKNLASGLKAMKRGSNHVPKNTSAYPVPTIVFHGDKDHVVNPVNAQNVLSQFDVAGVPEQYESVRIRSAGGMESSRSFRRDAGGAIRFEHWTIHGAGHAWSGGSSNGSYTEPRGPDASREMIRFFLEHRLASGHLMPANISN